ncbi:MAG: T9SS type A sorting domain-containing protein [Bacteroidota bacterium]
MRNLNRNLQLGLFITLSLIGNLFTGKAQTCPTPAITACTPTYVCVGDSLVLHAPGGYGHVTTVAGKPYGNIDGPLLSAQFYVPWSITSDMAGNLFVSDYVNYCIRKISASGIVSTYAGSQFSYYEHGYKDGPAAKARFNTVTAMVTDNSGNLFIAENGTDAIRKITPDGMVSTFAGSGINPGYVDDTGSAARFNMIQGMTFDAAGNLYVSDNGNFCIRKITPQGRVSTVAGMPGQPGFADGPAAQAKFQSPAGLTFDLAGNLIVCDAADYRIRKISPAGMVSTLAGNGTLGFTNGPANVATFVYPATITKDAIGNLFIGSTSHPAVRKISPDGIVSNFAGQDYTGNTNGPGNVATFEAVAGISIDAAGNMFVCDAGNNLIRKITPDGMVSTFAGSPFDNHQNGPAADAAFSRMLDIATDAAGNVFVSETDDWLGNLIRKISPAGIVSTLAGGNEVRTADSLGIKAGFYVPAGLAVSSTGNIFVSDKESGTIRKVTPAGMVSTFAGTAGQTGHEDGPGPAAKFNAPGKMAFDPAGNLYVADNNGTCIRKINPSGLVSTFAGSINYGREDGIGAAASFTDIGSIAFNPTDGFFYLNDNFYIRRLSLSGEVSTLASATYSGNYNSPCLAFLDWLSTIAFDRSGNLYFTVNTGPLSSGWNIRSGTSIRRITKEGGMSILAGDPEMSGFADGDYTTANLYFPYGMAFDNADNLYVADTYTRRVRKISIVNTDGYIWSNGAQTQKITAKQDGVLSVKVRYGACTTESSNIIELTTVPVPQTPVITYYNDTLDAGPDGLLFQWFFNGTPLTDLSRYRIGQPDGEYTVAAINENAIACTSAVSLPFVLNGLPAGISKTALHTLPNPTGGSFRIAGLKKSAEFSIFNSLGQPVFNGTADNDTQLNISNLPAGIYRLFAEGKQTSLVKTE